MPDFVRIILPFLGIAALALVIRLFITPLSFGAIGLFFILVPDAFWVKPPAEPLWEFSFSAIGILLITADVVRQTRRKALSKPNQQSAKGG